MIQSSVTRFHNGVKKFALLNMQYPHAKCSWEKKAVLPGQAKKEKANSCCRQSKEYDPQLETESTVMHYPKRCRLNIICMR